MSQVKIPSWYEFFKHLYYAYKLEQENPHFYETRNRFWRQQALRFGYDTESGINDLESGHRWKNFFFQNAFENALKKVQYCLSSFGYFERNFWKTQAHCIESLELKTNVSDTDFFEILQWCKNVKKIQLVGEMYRLSSSQYKVPKYLRSLTLDSFSKIDIQSLSPILSSIQELTLLRCREIPADLFDILSHNSCFQSLSIQNSPSFTSHNLKKLPRQIRALNLSGSRTHLKASDILLLPNSLKSLDLSHCSMNCIDVSTFDHFLNLKNLKLQGCFVLEPINIKKLPYFLEKLDLSRNFLRNEDEICLKDFTELHYLSLQNCIFSPRSQEKLTITLPDKIQDFRLGQQNSLSLKTKESLRSLKHLKKLSLENSFLSNEDVEFLPKTITKLSLSCSKEFSDLGLEALENFQNLEYLSLEGCEEIRGISLTHLPESLQTLSLKGCHRLSGKSLIYLPKSLRVLHVHDCDLISNQDLSTLPYSLEILRLPGCKKINYDSLLTLYRFPYLHTMEFSENFTTPEKLQYFAKKCRFYGRVQILNTQDDKKVARENSQGHHILKNHPSFLTLKKLTGVKITLFEQLFKLTTPF